jgi:hypothetical protein
MKINYVVAFYITDNSITIERNNLYHSLDKFYAVRYHIHSLNSFLMPDVSKVTFVVNKSQHVKEGEIEKIIEDTYISRIPIEVKYRDNWGLSYGAWEYHIRDSINESYDYYFLNEDDYCVSDIMFYEPFYKKFKENVAFVCGLYDGHPAISYKLISKTVCENVLNTYGELFKTYNDRLVDPSYEYKGWQGYYHINFLNSKYDITDVSDIMPLVYRRNKTITVFTNSTYDMKKPGYTTLVPLL